MKAKQISRLSAVEFCRKPAFRALLKWFAAPASPIHRASMLAIEAICLALLLLPAAADSFKARLDVHVFPEPGPELVAP